MFDLTVVGGGVIGMSIGYRAAREGMSVMVVGDDDPSQKTARNAARNASRSAAGILPPIGQDQVDDPLDALRSHSHRLFRHWSDEILASTGRDITLDQVGGYYIADTAGEVAATAAMMSEWVRTGTRVEPMDASELCRRVEVATGPTATRAKRAWWVPDEMVIDPIEFLTGLRMGIVHHGGVFRNDRARSVNRCEDGWTLGFQKSAKRRSPGRVQTRHVVLAGGVSIGGLSVADSVRGCVIPVRGQMLRLAAGRYSPRAILNVGQRYIVPRRDRTVLVGSVEQEVGEDYSTDEATLSGLREFAASLIPELSTAPELERWAGLRPMTFDGMPMIGPLPGRPGVWIAGGHYRSGIHLSVATADCLVAAVAGRSPAVDLAPFALTGRVDATPIEGSDPGFRR